MGTQSTVDETIAELERVAAAHSRALEVVREDSDGIGPTHGTTLALLTGIPEIRVELNRDFTDDVIIEEAYVLTVPRADTVGAVTALVSGRARLSYGAGSWWSRVLGTFLRNPLSARLRVPVDDRAGAREYTVDVPYSPSGWLSTVPSETAPTEPRTERAG